MPLPSARANKEEDRPSKEEFSVKVDSGQEESGQEECGEKSSGEEGSEEREQSSSKNSQ